MTTRERAEKIYKALGRADLIDAPDEENADLVVRMITEAETAAYDAALRDAAAILRRNGSLNAAKLLLALLEDVHRVRAGRPTNFAALRENVPLPQ